MTTTEIKLESTLQLSAMEVVARVRSYVEQVKVGDVTLRLDEENIQLRTDYWRLPVRPSRDPENFYDYVEALAKLENEIEAKEKIKIMIASGNPLVESDLTVGAVAGLVRRFVAQANFKDITLWLDAKSIQLVQDTWRITVRPSKEPSPLPSYLAFLATLEQAIEQKEGVKVSFSSGEPLVEIELTAAIVASRVRCYLADAKVGEVSLWLDEANITLRNDYWRLPIRPSKEPESLHRCVHAITQIEMEIQDMEGIKVILSLEEPLDETSFGVTEIPSTEKRVSETIKTSISNAERLIEA